MKSWYAVYTQAGMEGVAATNLSRQGYDTYLPHFHKTVRHARRVTVKDCPLFPRYLFVNCDLEAARWRPINSTVGVLHLVCSGTRPAAIADVLIGEIRAREDEQGCVVMARAQPFTKGQPVRILSGAFCDQIGLFDCPSDDERVIILLSLLGKDISLRVPETEVAAA